MYRGYVIGFVTYVACQPLRVCPLILAFCAAASSLLTEDDTAVPEHKAREEHHRQYMGPDLSHDAQRVANYCDGDAEGAVQDVCGLTGSASWKPSAKNVAKHSYHPARQNPTEGRGSLPVSTSKGSI